MPWLSLVIAFVFVLGGASPSTFEIATPETAPLPDATAPHGLADVALPSDAEAISDLFARLPETVAGEEQADRVQATDRMLVPYGEEDPSFGHPLVLGAVSLEESGFFPPGFSVRDYVSGALATADTGAIEGGRDGTLVWVLAETTAGIGGERPGTPEVSRPLYTLVWGDLDGAWLFTAVADSPENLDALVTAFVRTVSNHLATPDA